MLDQDTARALLTIADEAGARVALVGDRHQLPAVGRGGVLDLARPLGRPGRAVSTWTWCTGSPAQPVGEDGTPPGAGPEYAQLTLAMRDGRRPGRRVRRPARRAARSRLHDSELDRQHALADDVVAARQAAARATVVVDTREQAAALNARSATGWSPPALVDDRHTSPSAGPGSGSVPAT